MTWMTENLHRHSTQVSTVSGGHTYFFTPPPLLRADRMVLTGFHDTSDNFLSLGLAKRYTFRNSMQAHILNLKRQTDEQHQSEDQDETHRTIYHSHACITAMPYYLVASLFFFLNPMSPLHQCLSGWIFM